LLNNSRSTIFRSLMSSIRMKDMVFGSHETSLLKLDSERDFYMTVCTDDMKLSHQDNIIQVQLSSLNQKQWVNHH
uniref:Ovule protein n=1 Tax=Anisakis simplex TaxID=6269 RepID=A0A0M3JE46_ANISI